MSISEMNSEITLAAVWKEVGSSVRMKEATAVFQLRDDRGKHWMVAAEEKRETNLTYL